MRLSAADISKSYEGKTVLSGCSLDTAPGAVHIITGANGSGKSTFLRICSLLESPDSGRVRFYEDSGYEILGPALKRRITLVLSDIGIFNDTVRGNIAYGLKIRGMSKSNVYNKTDDVLSSFGLLDKAAQNALTLSSGEMRRLGIARAMAINPEILLLDEPTASVDERNCEIIESLILSMKKNRTTTIIMTTHDTGQAERIADVRLQMKKGRLEVQ